MPGTNQLIAQLLGLSLLCQNWKSGGTDSTTVLRLGSSFLTGNIYKDMTVVHHEKSVTVCNDVTDLAGNYQGKTFGAATGCFRIFWTFWRTAA